MKKFKELVAEIYEPKSQDEKDFIGQHVIKTFDYPVKNKDGLPFRDDSIRPPGPQHKKGPYHPPEEPAKVYTKANEEVENLDEVSRAKIKNYLNRAFTDVGNKELAGGEEEKVAKRKASMNLATRKGGGADKIYGNKSQFGKSRAAAVQPARVQATEEVNDISEKKMTPTDIKQREDIVKGMKKSAADLKKRYGDRWKAVMYATATKRAMEEEISKLNKHLGISESVNIDIDEIIALCDEVE